MSKQEDSELVSSPKQTKILPTYRQTICENDLETSRKQFPQLKMKRKNCIQTGGGPETQSGWDIYPSTVTHKWEENHNLTSSP